MMLEGSALRICLSSGLGAIKLKWHSRSKCCVGRSTRACGACESKREESRSLDYFILHRLGKLYIFSPLTNQKPNVARMIFLFPFLSLAVQWKIVQSISPILPSSLVMLDVMLLSANSSPKASGGALACALLDVCCSTRILWITAWAVGSLPESTTMWVWAGLIIAPVTPTSRNDSWTWVASRPSTFIETFFGPPLDCSSSGSSGMPTHIASAQTQRKGVQIRIAHGK